MRDNPKMRKEMGHNARKHIVEKWQWKYFVPGWKKFLREATK